LLKLSTLKCTEFPEEPGVYVIFWLRGENNVEICRFLGVDKKGVLYVGSAKNLRKRCRSLKRNILLALQVAKGKDDSKIRNFTHTLAPSLLYTGLAEIISLEELRIYYKVFSTEEEARDQEALILYEYTRRYGEPPPLNLKIGREYLMILGIGRFGKSKLVGDLDPELASMLGLSEKS